ncbi:MAG: TonB-dependent receptor, partial [Gammaproteobacteria bacterium]|nr:TonB-dependent receptor [Gammaproteobacteria bacterium]
DSHDGNWRLVLGASARRDNVSTPLYLGTNETLENRVYRLFSNLEWRLTPRLIMNAGAMLENNDITGTDLSPRLAFNYRLNPNHTLRTSVSKALRTPVQIENRADYKLTFGSKFVSTLVPFLSAFAPDVLADLDAKRSILTGPGDLKPEKIVSREISYLGTFPDYGLDMDIRLFYDSISNIIQSVDIPASTGTGRTISNDYSVKSHGWEAQLNWKPSSTNRLALTYAKLHQHADSNNQVKTSRKTIRTIDNLRHSAPRHTFSLLGIHRFPKQITASAAYYLIGTQSWLGEGNADIPYIRRLDLRLAKEFRIGRSRLDLALVAQNVLDDYTDLLFEPGEPERHNIVNSRVFLTLGMEF